ncbi:DNA cytosine methyltransferase [Streptomyces sp. NPDC087305]|uniref:DNA cytosine methyltransferase n=1 Tax=Streptomyces sp. NPDC087305 TaxID=3365781 RepID=UPI00380BD99E
MTGPRIGSVCSGYAGLDIAVQSVVGGAPAWFADPDKGAAAILAHHHPDTPNLGDIKAVQWGDVEPVDIYTGGYPCQPFSTVGQRKGTDDPRHLWPYIATAVRVLRPRICFFENVAGHVSLGLDTVLADLAGSGFDAEWLTLHASDVGAAHQRKRVFVLAWLADTAHDGREWSRSPRHGWDGLAYGNRVPADAARHALRGQPRRLRSVGEAASEATQEREAGRHESAPGTGRAVPTGVGDVRDFGIYGPAVARWETVTGRRAPRATDVRGRLNPEFVEWLMGLESGHVTGVPGLSRRAQLRALGNGVVPQQAAVAFAELLHRAGLADRLGLAA